MYTADDRVKAAFNDVREAKILTQRAWLLIIPLKGGQRPYPQGGRAFEPCRYWNLIRPTLIALAVFPYFLDIARIC
jgi:hypothetical protein